MQMHRILVAAAPPVVTERSVTTAPAHLVLLARAQAKVSWLVFSVKMKIGASEGASVLRVGKVQDVPAAFLVTTNSETNALYAQMSLGCSYSTLL